MLGPRHEPESPEALAGPWKPRSCVRAAARPIRHLWLAQKLAGAHSPVRAVAARHTVCVTIRPRSEPDLFGRIGSVLWQRSKSTVEVAWRNPHKRKAPTRAYHLPRSSPRSRLCRSRSCSGSGGSPRRSRSSAAHAWIIPYDSTSAKRCKDAGLPVAFVAPERGQRRLALRRLRLRELEEHRPRPRGGEPLHLRRMPDRHRDATPVGADQRQGALPDALARNSPARSAHFAGHAHHDRTPPAMDGALEPRDRPFVSEAAQRVLPAACTRPSCCLPAFSPARSS